MNKIEKEIRDSGEFSEGMNGVAVIDNTFAVDFTIADAFGASAIKDTYKRSFDCWKKDIKYMTALAIVLNHKGWQHYNTGMTPYSKMYFDLWEEIDSYILDCENAGEENEKYTHFDREEIEYFVRAVD